MEQSVNTVGAAVMQSPPNEEKIEVTVDALTPRMNADDFGRAVDEKIQTSTKYWAKFNYDTRGKLNDKYYAGDQVDKSSLRDDLEKGVDNIIFRNLETFIPIATSRTPQIGTTPAYKNDTTRTYSQDVRRTLQTEWEVYQSMQQLVSRAIRNHQSYFIGIAKLGYDPETDEFWTEEIPATSCVISKNGDFVAQYIKDETLGDLITRFPDKKQEILEQAGYRVAGEPSKEIMDSPVEYIEAWMDDMVGWKLGKLTLGVEVNPHFMYQKKKVQIGTDPSGQPITAEVAYNHFKKARKPFIFLTYFTKGRHILDETTLIEQAIGLQDWVNKRKRQIGANADSTNGHWVSSGDFISQEEFEKIQGGVDEKIWLESGMPRDGLAKITGIALPDYIFNDLTHSESALDNLMGTHSTTRGEKSGNDTLGQDIMQKDQDYGRVDGYVRDGIEKFAQDWYEYMYHMYLVYRTEDKAIAIPAEDDLEDSNVVFSQDRVPLIKRKNGEVIPVPMVLRVKQGSTLPMDELAEYQKAVNMKDILRPMDYFKKVGESNPKQLEKNLLMWQNDPYAAYKDDPDIQEMLKKMQQNAQQGPKMSVSVRADANTPVGAKMLEEQGLLPKGVAVALAKTPQSPKPGQPILTPQAPTDESQPQPPVDMQAADAGNQQQQSGISGLAKEKEGLVNAMTYMIRSGEAQKIVQSAQR